MSNPNARCIVTPVPPSKSFAEVERVWLSSQGEGGPTASLLFCKHSNQLDPVDGDSFQGCSACNHFVALAELAERSVGEQIMCSELAKEFPTAAAATALESIASDERRKEPFDQVVFSNWCKTLAMGVHGGILRAARILFKGSAVGASIGGDYCPGRLSGALSSYSTITGHDGLTGHRDLAKMVQDTIHDAVDPQKALGSDIPVPIMYTAAGLDRVAGLNHCAQRLSVVLKATDVASRAVEVVGSNCALLSASVQGVSAASSADGDNGMATHTDENMNAEHYKSLEPAVRQIQDNIPIMDERVSNCASSHSLPVY